jgi:hypothetical protein
MDTALQKKSMCKFTFTLKGFYMQMKSETWTFNSNIMLYGKSLGSYGLFYLKYLAL